MDSLPNKLLINLFLILILPLNCQSQGLFFNGLGTNLQERSSFSVFDNKNCVFKNHFEVSFKFCLYDLDAFGCIFLLEDKKTGAQYNLTQMRGMGNYSLLKFNVGENNNLITRRIEPEQRKWMNFSSHFYLDADSVCIGGFGNMRYNRNFFAYDLFTQKWDTVHYTGDRISPRYFQGMVYRAIISISLGEWIMKSATRIRQAQLL
jgi:hypothetical protein